MPTTQLVSDQTDHVQSPIVALPADWARRLPGMRDAARRGPGPRAALARLVNEAERALTHEPCSVVDDPLTAPSGNRRDYTSLATYWWPNPDTNDGLPYVRHDGDRNPETLAGDFVALKQTCDDVVTLILAAYFSGEPRYAKHAAELLRVFFLDDTTGMNPHLKYAQRIPGVCDGRYIGLIDTHQLVPIVELLPLLRDTGQWPDRDDAALRDWFAKYLHWLSTDEFGQRERAHPNNHGTWCDAQLVAYAAFTGQTDQARDVLRGVAERRIVAHVAPDGSQPEEIQRTLSFTYSVFNLQALVTLAQIGERLGVDLWSFEDADGRSIPAALRYLAPYLNRPDTWPHAQIKPIVTRKLYWLLQIAVDSTGDVALREAMGGHDPGDDPAQLLYATA
jgi:hypothetical protein